MQFGLVIPTLNPRPWLDRLLPAIASQTVQPARFIVMDSSSDDGSTELLREFGATVLNVDRGKFDHGGTRQHAIDLMADLPAVVLLTQDAVPADATTFAALLSAFEDPKVGMAYGRQLPRPGSRAIEAHARHFNYPNVSRIDDSETLAQRGIRASFCSNSFSAYRVAALTAVGGLPTSCIFGEDAVAAVRLMRDGWSKAYVSKAAVFHSHAYSIKQDLKRGFDIGVLHSSAPEMIAASAGTGSEGAKYVKSEIAYLLKNEIFSLPSAGIRTFAKYFGYKLGRNYSRMPSSVVQQLTLNRAFWK